MIKLTAEQIDVGLRAMKTVAAANGVFEEHERALVASAASIVGVRVDVDALGTATPEEVGRAFPTPDLRLKVLQAMVVMALVDGEASDDEVHVLEHFRSSLGVDDGSVKAVRRLAGGHLWALRFDFARRMPIIKQVVGATWKEEGVKGLHKLVQVFRGVHEDADLAWRYKRLGLLPAGTLGREFWAHMTASGFAFPGERGGLPEKAVHHDMTHVLAGYNTDAKGEIQIAGFYSGMLDSDPFALVLGTLLTFHVGVQLSPIATPVPMQWEPEPVLRAMERGAKCKVKLWDGWDFWAVVDRPLDELRAEYGIAAA